MKTFTSFINYIISSFFMSVAQILHQPQKHTTTQIPQNSTFVMNSFTVRVRLRPVCRLKRKIAPDLL